MSIQGMTPEKKHMDQQKVAPSGPSEPRRLAEFGSSFGQSRDNSSLNKTETISTFIRGFCLLINSCLLILE